VISSIFGCGRSPRWVFRGSSLLFLILVVPGGAIGGARCTHWTRFPITIHGMQFLVAIILLGIVGGICWSLLIGPAEYVIRYSRGTVRFDGRFPRSRRAEVEEFFKREFPQNDRIKVSAVKAPQRGLRFVIRGKISEGDRQRIRNFLHAMR
jgi:hypothetical protein